MKSPARAGLFMYAFRHTRLGNGAANIPFRGFPRNEDTR